MLENIDPKATIGELKAADEVNELTEDVLVDGPARFLGLMGRVGRALKPLSSSSRYLGYTSDVGEAFRPVISQRIVSGAYYVSYAYVATDVGLAAYKSRLSGGTSTDIARVASHTLVFQGLASLALPAVIIHTQVNYATKLFTTVKSLMPYQRYGPTLAGLALIPFLPTLCDYPVEVAVDTMFEKFWPRNTHTAPEVVDLQEKKEL
eukprot:CFRG3823T1